MRGKRTDRSYRFLFPAWILLAGIVPSPAVAACAGGCEASLRTCATIETIACVPDAEISLSDFLFRISACEGPALSGPAADPDPSGKALDRLAMRVAARLVGNRDPERVVSAVNGVLFEEEGFAYDPGPGNPETFLLDRVLSRRRGNCLGLTAVYLALADRLDLPFRAVYVPSHSFVRYEGNGARINVETAEKGTGHGDGWYEEKFRLKKGTPYLRTLGKRETVGLYLKSLGTVSSRKGREEDALGWYRDAARFYPGLPDIRYNAGVSCQRLGRNREAIDHYRAALTLYADMAPARGNLAAALCSCGNVEDGIREYRKALEIDPSSRFANEGLVKAYIASGNYRAALEQRDRHLGFPAESGN